MNTPIWILTFFISSPALASPFFLGDSIAQGYKTAIQAEGITKVGAQPSAVLKMVQKAAGKNRDVVLSSGISNNCLDWKSVEKQMAALSIARVRLLGNNNCAGANQRLQKICSRYPRCTFQPVPRGRDGVHPNSYRANWAVLNDHLGDFNHQNFKLCAKAWRQS